MPKVINDENKTMSREMTYKRNFLNMRVCNRFLGQLK